jgi:hypothetical protein
MRNHVLLLIEHAGDSAIRQSFLAYTHESLEYLIEDIRLYWRRVLMPHWARIIAVLEGDILYRARRMALYGADAVFEDLHPGLTYNDGEIVISYTHDHADKKDRSLVGERFQLLPMIFSFEDLCRAGKDESLTLGYGALADSGIKIIAEASDQCWRLRWV